MATTNATDANGLHYAPSPLPPPQEAPTSALALDRKIVQALFVSLRMSIPQDVQRRLLSNAAEELEFLIVRQPRVSAFHHRRRESLRHPALAMAAKKYYRECRRRRFELELQQMAAVEGQPLSQSTNSPAAQVRSGVSAVQRESVLVDLLFSEYAQQSSIYFKDQDFQGDHYGRSTGNGAAGFGGFAASHPSISLNTYAASTPPRLLGRMIRETDSEASLQPPTTPRSGHAVELSSTMTSGKSGILRHRSPALRHLKSSEDSVSALSEALNTGSFSRFGLNVTVAENAEKGGNARARGMGVGVSTTAVADGARFFARRMGCNDNAAVRHGGDKGSGAGDKFPSGWTGEMRVLLQRRTEEEREAGTCNDPYLFISARPVEHLLCCYGGVSREPAIMALGAASMLLQCDSTNTADADPFRNAIVEEDMRWDQLAGCHRQLLRAAYGPCRAGAAAVASDRLVNDVIRRFWDRLTVSMAAQHAHKAQEARKSRAAADANIAAAASALRGRSDREADEDDLNEISDSDAKGEGAAAGTGAGTGGDDVSRKKATAISLSRRKRSASKLSRTRKSVSKLSRKKKRKGGGAVSSGVGGGSEQHSSVAYYMTPLQYVYLHTRIAHVLLPECDAVEVELLPYIQEDLLVDAAYDEGDAAQPFYFGEAPRLVGDFGRQHRRSTVAGGAGSTTRTSLVDIKLQGANYEDAGDDRMSTAGGETQRDALYLQRRFLSVRRNGYALSRPTGGGASDVGGMREIGLGDDWMSIGPTSSMAVTIDDGMMMRRADGCDWGIGKSYAMASVSLVPMSFTVAQLPSLTYPQFWCSMMELADNWTCCAGNPVETAIFMWELYVEVFGHNWDEEDKVLANAVESKAAKSAISAAEKAELAKEEADTMESFQALLAEVSGRLSQPLSWCRSLNSITSMTEAIHTAADRYRSRRPRSKTKRGVRTSSQSTQSTDSDDDESLLLASSLDLSLSELKRLTEAKTEGNDGWVYSERVDEDGVTHRYRRRVCGGESHSSSHSISEPGLNNGSYIVEEEMDKDGAVVSRRKLRWHVALSSDCSLYTADERAPEFLRRKYFEDRAKKLRRLEPWRRVTSGHSGSDSRSSSMTSWSSIGDCDSDDRRNRRRRRRRTRHTGLRRDHPRYLRKDDQYWYTECGVKPGWKFPYDDDEADGGDDGARAQGPRKSELTQEEREHLLARKEWLCSVLEAQGIHLPPHVLDDPAEQMLLYDFLRLAEAREGGADQSNYRGGSDDDYHLEDGEAGDTGNLSRLAALMAKLQGFTLDDLENSSLMRRLLGESEAEGAVNRNLTPQQVQDILAALTKGKGPGGARAEAGRAEQESARERRLRLLRMLEENRALQQQRREDAAAAGPTESLLTKETFGLTEVPPPPPRPPSSKRPPKSTSSTNHLKPIALSQPPSAQSPPSFAQSSSHIGFSYESLNLPERRRVPSRESSAASTARLVVNPVAWKISPTTLAERKELERLFRELEAYWADRASQGGRFRVDIIDYTPEQLEEFFTHLHLGPRQRALLRGRAPLAAATSLVGGAMHQDGSCSAFKRDVAAAAQRQHSHAGCGQPTHSLIPSPTPLAPAPVKLFTLTTEDSLDGALRHSYQSYMEDKIFSEALHGNVKLDTARSAHVSTAAQSLRPPPLPRLKLRDSRWKASGERAGGVSTTSAAPRPPPKLSPPSSSLPRL
ncbi:conserved hypothetical protein [Leishmania mexicana MHOM/GT/2001/U1103]|uniref:Uncharacterized protein n=1 Tax=Leishmania mexicana (strain MHOM/GT/2001/U1103) TaxID=929439 RepID=E9B611_LEIMU|nr:conserved hypothetical protein [Leishmania mexicana MHOM/GT/2001/U1103]CBZ30682.1 conserved hypothetical protein [Leishmania mexicana MHOM/GT/2001/U1103]